MTHIEREVGLDRVVRDGLSTPPGGIGGTGDPFLSSLFLFPRCFRPIRKGPFFPSLSTFDFRPTFRPRFTSLLDSPFFAHPLDYIREPVHTGRLFFLLFPPLTKKFAYKHHTLCQQTPLSGDASLLQHIKSNPCGLQTEASRALVLE